MYKRKEEIIVPQTVLMEISFRGIHIIDKKKKNVSSLYLYFPFVEHENNTIYLESLSVKHI